ncbi:MAG TPA: VOC family protein, partial [Roseiflexaceae bacterium]|nr:VOC family protein [Roseiflexaceae bacterium]
MLGLEPLPSFNFDYPVQFYRLNAQQLHLSECDDQTSFRGHVCFQTDDFSALFRRMRELGAIDIAPWGRVRRLPDGSPQMFVRDPAGNLLEFTSPPQLPVDEAVFGDELAETGANMYISNRGDGCGTRGSSATLYHGEPA